MKIIIALAFAVLLSGCAEAISERDMLMAQEFCKQKNNQLYKVEVTYYGGYSLRVHCRGGF